MRPYIAFAVSRPALAATIVVAFSLPLFSKETPSARLPRYMGREIATTMHYTGADWLTRSRDSAKKIARRC